VIPRPLGGHRPPLQRQKSARWNALTSTRSAPFAAPRVARAHWGQCAPPGDRFRRLAAHSLAVRRRRLFRRFAPAFLL